MVCDKHEKPSTMAPQKRLGVGASCTIKLHFLHPKNTVNEVIPNQMASQELSGLIAQKWEFQAIWREQKECVIFHHEDFGGQLLWALHSYVSVDIEGAQDMLFVESPPPATTVPAADSDGVDGGQEGGNNNDNDNKNNDNRK